VYTDIKDNREPYEISNISTLLQISLLYLVGILGIGDCACGFCQHVFLYTILTSSKTESIAGRKEKLDDF
jgi:hypothetical protein